MSLSVSRAAAPVAFRRCCQSANGHRRRTLPLGAVPPHILELAQRLEAQRREFAADDARALAQEREQGEESLMADMSGKTWDAWDPLDGEEFAGADLHDFPAGADAGAASTPARTAAERPVDRRDPGVGD